MEKEKVVNYCYAFLLLKFFNLSSFLTLLPLS